VDLLEVWHVPLTAPSLQSQLRYAEYRVEVAAEWSGEEMRVAVDCLMRARELPWQHMRDTGPRLYDLRPLIDRIWLEGEDKVTFVLGMRLLCGPQGTGRPEQVAAALGVKEHPLSTHRTGLVLAEG
jgi:hypothetical protein